MRLCHTCGERPAKGRALECHQCGKARRARGDYRHAQHRPGARCTAIEQGSQCERPARLHRLCSMHYRRIQATGSVERSQHGACTVFEDGVPCGRPIHARGLCNRHRQRFAKYKPEEHPCPTCTEEMLDGICDLCDAIELLNARHPDTYELTGA